MPTPARPLDLMDLPSAADILSEEEHKPASALSASKPVAPAPGAPSGARSALPPLPAAKLGAVRPATAPKLPSLAPLALPKPKAAPAAAPRSAMGALLNLPVAVPQALHLDLPAGVGNEELEIEIRVMQKGHQLAQVQTVRPVPQHGGHLRLSLDLKRG